MSQTQPNPKKDLPVTVYIACIDVITAFLTPERLKADSRRLVGQNINESIFELIDG